MGKIKAVIFDWGGTMVDYGCFAPVDALIKVFEEKGVSMTAEEVRAPMGLEKKEHIRLLSRLETVSRQWEENFGKLPGQDDIEELYRRFEPALAEIQPEYSKPVPGFTEVYRELKEKGIRIGSTTGYSKSMMEVVKQQAVAGGFLPEAVVTPDDVPKGRPYPWMCFKNMVELEVFPPSSCLKVGDTVSDVKEGVNAGMWSAAIIRGGSELGLSAKEIENMPEEELSRKVERVRERFLAAGAHFVLEDITLVMKTIEDIASGMD